MRNYKQGFYKPRNPEKYKGNPDDIVYRSSWELIVMKKLDLNPSVMEWSSEETIIPYFSVVDNRTRRYFVDFTVKVKQKDGSIKNFLIEVKPYKQTIPPVKGRKKKKTFIKEEMEFIRNQNKWDSARKWAERNNHEFLILTEKETNGN